MSASPRQASPAPRPAGGVLRDRFEDFDDPAIYEKAVKHGLNPNSRNFVVQFGGETAKIALDLDSDHFEALMAQKNLRSKDGPIRWINIWDPGAQPKVIAAIAKEYGFSARLMMSLQIWDLMRRNTQLQKGKRAPTKLGEGAKSASKTPDLEKGPLNGPPDQKKARVAPAMDDENMATFLLMQSSLNFTSIDQERKFVCLGANWLHKRPGLSGLKQKKAKGTLVPPNHWSWFALCDDNTVLSFHEAPRYDIPKGVDETAWQTEELSYIRSNTLKALRQLSKIELKPESLKNYLQLTSVRQPLMNSTSAQTRVPENQVGIEGSSNLFYYLFENYSTAADILNTSKDILQDLGRRILLSEDKKRKDKSQNIIPRLYRLNKELRQLQHLFSSYKILIDRLLGDKNMLTDHGSSVEKLSKKAQDRFERLRDQIQTLMLDTIKESLDEKESLQATYFNITQQKDSAATARLTRSATLLAKFSVFFLPITFVTSYFSVQIPDLTDHVAGATYWSVVGIIAGISLISIFFFGKLIEFLSDRAEAAADNVVRWFGEKFGWVEKKKKKLRHHQGKGGSDDEDDDEESDSEDEK